MAGVTQIITKEEVVELMSELGVKYSMQSMKKCECDGPEGTFKNDLTIGRPSVGSDNVRAILHLHSHRWTPFRFLHSYNNLWQHNATVVRNKKDIKVMALS
jgi:hypothetical protein